MAEHTDAGARPATVMVAGLVLLGVLLAALALAWLSWRFWEPNGPNAAPAMTLQGPALEPAPQPALAEFQRRQQAAREQWGWVEGERGVARIPLREAETLLIARESTRHRRAQP